MSSLKNELYGLKHAFKAWYKKIHAYLTTQGFKNSPTERSHHVKMNQVVFFVSILYVDDMLHMSLDEGHIVELKSQLHSIFKISNLSLLH